MSIESIKKKLLRPSDTEYSLLADKPEKALITVQKAKIKISQRIKLCNISRVCMGIFFAKIRVKEDMWEEEEHLSAFQIVGLLRIFFATD